MTVKKLEKLVRELEKDLAHAIGRREIFEDREARIREELQTAINRLARELLKTAKAVQEPA